MSLLRGNVVTMLMAAAPQPQTNPRASFGKSLRSQGSRDSCINDESCSASADRFPPVCMYTTMSTSTPNHISSDLLHPYSMGHQYSKGKDCIMSGTVLWEILSDDLYAFAPHSTNTVNEKLCNKNTNTNLSLEPTKDVQKCHITRCGTVKYIGYSSS